MDGLESEVIDSFTLEDWKAIVPTEARFDSAHPFYGECFETVVEQPGIPGVTGRTHEF